MSQSRQSPKRVHAQQYEKPKAIPVKTAPTAGKTGMFSGLFGKSMSGYGFESADGGIVFGHPAQKSPRSGPRGK